MRSRNAYILLIIKVGLVKKLYGTLISFFFLAGCSSMTISDVSQSSPKLVLEKYFLGKTYASGIFEDRFGNVRRQFTVDIEGTFDQNVLHLIEDFVFNDGERETREWMIKKTGKNTYEGRADDVIGVARGQSLGNTLNWHYDMRLKIGGSSVKVHFNDWMFLQPNGVLINKAMVSKLGVDIGRVTLAFTKTADIDFTAKLADFYDINPVAAIAP
jgi:hypothetical protein